MKKLRNEENRNKKKEKRRKGIQGEGQQSIIGIIWSRENTQLSLSDILERFYLENKWR